MKHRLTCLIALLLSACTVDTPIVETSDRLGESIEARCESFCSRAIECDTVDVAEVCPANCVEYFTETYAGKGEICSGAADRLMDCLDAASCHELKTGEACNVRAEEELCFESQGLYACYGGGSGGDTDGFCDVMFEDCTNGRTYRLTCLGTSDPPECDCLVDGEVTGTFVRNSPECPEEFEVKQICGFPVADSSGEPAAPPRTACDVGGSASNGAGAGFYDCQTSFERCSDGHYYEIICEGPPGAVSCYCSVDGEHVDQNLSPTGICPFLNDPSYGAIASNYICGFRIAPTTGQ
jgi:hypothetical protein